MPVSICTLLRQPRALAGLWLDLRTQLLHAAGVTCMVRRGGNTAKYISVVPFPSCEAVNENNIIKHKAVRRVLTSKINISLLCLCGLGVWQLQKLRGLPPLSFEPLLALRRLFCFIALGPCRNRPLWLGQISEAFSQQHFFEVRS